MAYEDIKKYQFPKGVSGNPKGRPKKFTTILKDNGYKISEINDTIQVMLAMSVKELETVEKYDKATVLERTIAKAMLKSLKNGSLYSMETLLSRTFGQPKQEMSTEITLPQPLFPDVIIKKD
tara:strand:- start:3469 stop:3834 length:366 start_codon:yes stop_codon:yes gene_type:complete